LNTRSKTTLILLLGALLASCDFAAGKSEPKDDSKDCRELRKKNPDCHWGEKNDSETFEYTFTKPGETETWQENQGNWKGFSLSMPAGTFTKGTLTVTATLRLSSSSALSSLVLEGDQNLEKDAIVSLPLVMRDRYEMTDYKMLLINFSKGDGFTRTLSKEIVRNEETGNASVSLKEWGEITVSKSPDPPLLKIKLTDEDTKVAIGATTTVKAEGWYADGTTKDLTDRAEWKTEDELTAYFDSAVEVGTVVGQTEGTTKMTATYKDVAGKGIVTVLGAQVVSIKVSPETTSIKPKATDTFTAMATLSDDTAKDVSADCVWSSQDENIFTVAGDGENEATVTGSHEGKSNVVCTYTNEGTDDEVTGSAEVIVLAPDLESISIKQEAPTVTRVGTIQLSADGLYSDGETRDITSLVEWTSTDTGKATINNNNKKGFASGVAAGTTTIRISYTDMDDAEVELEVTSTGATKLLFTVAPPASVIPNMPINPSIKVSAVDETNAVDRNWTGTVELTLADDTAGDTELRLYSDKSNDANDKDRVIATAVSGVATFIAEIHFVSATTDVLQLVAAKSARTYTFTAADASTSQTLLSSATSNNVVLKKPFTARNKSGGSCETDGTQCDSFDIATLEDLDAIRLYLTSATPGTRTFRVTQNIDASASTSYNNSRGFIPIGHYLNAAIDNEMSIEISNNGFNGIFDGGGYRISGLKIYSYASDGLTGSGLFARNNGTIGDVTLSGLNANAIKNNVCGSIAGINDNGASITNVYVEHDASQTMVCKHSLGGIAGRNYASGSVQKAAFRGSLGVENSNLVGGIVGEALAATGVAVAGTVANTVTHGKIVTSSGSTALINADAGLVAGKAANSNFSSNIVYGSVAGNNSPSLTDKGVGGAFGSVLRTKTPTFSLTGVISDAAVKSTSFQSAGMIGIAKDLILNRSITAGSNHFTGSNPKLSSLIGDLLHIDGNANGYTNELYRSISMCALPTGATLIGHNSTSASLSTISDRTVTHSTSNATGTETPEFRNSRIEFVPTFRNGLKVGASDKLVFPVKGFCGPWYDGLDVRVSFTGSTSVVKSTTCVAGRWETTANLSLMSDASITVKVEQQTGSCTFDSNCPSKTVTISKSAATCAGANAALTNAFTSGSGNNAGDPYLICNASQLQLAKDNLSKHFKLGNNIDVGSNNFIPIGNSTTGFTGSFDGNGFEIRRLTVIGTMKRSGSAASPHYLGLFGAVGIGATINNVTITDAIIMGGSNIGILAGEISTANNLDNIAVSGSVNQVAGGSSAGGVIGHLANTDMSNIVVDARVAGADKVGGMVGFAEASSSEDTATNIDVHGLVTASGDELGAVIGASSAYNLTTGIVRGGVTGNNKVGGIVGSVNGTVTILTIDAHASSISSGANGGKIYGFTGGSAPTTTDTDNSVNAITGT